MNEREMSNTRLLLLLLLPVLAGAQTPSPNATSAVPGTVVLRVRINGVFVNMTNCTLSSLGSVTCNSDLQHDVTVTRADSPGTESWVVAMIIVNSAVLVVVTGVAIGSYFYRARQPEPAPQYQPVPAYNPYQPNPPYNPYQPDYQPGYQNAARKVIEVGLVRPLPAQERL